MNHDPTLPVTTNTNTALTAAIDSAVNAAARAADRWACSSGVQRAVLLEALAAALELKRPELLVLADSETHLGLVRLGGELDRTCFQLRAFAQFSRDGRAFDVTDVPAVAGSPPEGHPHLRRVRVPLGPVAMFSASNFPFAFSVLGGDTASALSAGCPVVVKAHPAHRLLSAAVYQVAQNVLADLNLPSGLIAHIELDSYDAGLQLVSHPDIHAVAFTGSLAGGLALGNRAQSRPRPIPFYGELGSVNPVIVLPDALDQNVEDHARQLATSITQGSGQFCTSPGLLLMMDSPQARLMVGQLASEIDRILLHSMLSERIRHGFDAGVNSLRSHPQVQTMTSARSDVGQQSGFVGLTSALAFMADERLRHEVFGASCLCVLANSYEELGNVLQTIGGSLTVTLWGADADSERNRHLVRTAQQMSGRVLFKGVPTGVAVAAAQHHGGPWPASTQPLFTSVGLAACDRFLRPVALQDAPVWLLQRDGVPV